MCIYFFTLLILPYCWMFSDILFPLPFLSPPYPFFTPWNLVLIPCLICELTRQWITSAPEGCSNESSQYQSPCRTTYISKGFSDLLQSSLTMPSFCCWCYCLDSKLHCEEINLIWFDLIWFDLSPRMLRTRKPKTKIVRIYIRPKR